MSPAQVIYPPADSTSGAYYRQVLRDEGFGAAGNGNDNELNLEALLPPGLRRNDDEGAASAAAAADGGSVRAAKQAVASLPKGAYRRVLQRVHDVQVEEAAAAAVAAVRTHASDADNGGATGDAAKVAVVLRFSLPAGSFATALLREVTHNDAFI